MGEREVENEGNEGQSEGLPRLAIVELAHSREEETKHRGEGRSFAMRRRLGWLEWDGRVSGRFGHGDASIAKDVCRTYGARDQLNWFPALTRWAKLRRVSGAARSDVGRSEDRPLQRALQDPHARAACEAPSGPDGEQGAGTPTGVGTSKSQRYKRADAQGTATIPVGWRESEHPSTRPPRWTRSPSTSSGQEV
jgi:hypothetical protein